MIKLLKLFVVFFLGYVSCLQAQKNVKNYYYPLGKKKTIMVYKYVDKNDTTNIEYWKVITSPVDQTIKTISYDRNFRVYNVFEELITQKGAQLTRYTDYEISKNGKNIPILSTVQKTNVYLWSPSEAYKYAVTYKNKYGSFEFTKSRKFVGIKKITVHGKKYKVAAFKDDYLMYEKYRNDKFIFHQRTYYAKNIGMVKYERKLPEQKQRIELELTEILTEAAFETLQR